MVKSYKIDFKMQKKRNTETSIKDGHKFDLQVVFKGTTGEKDNQVILNFEILGNPVNVESILNAMGVDKIDDIISARFKMVLKQASLFDNLKDDEKVQKKEIDDEEPEEN